MPESFTFPILAHKIYMVVRRGCCLGWGGGGEEGADVLAGGFVDKGLLATENSACQSKSGTFWSSYSLPIICVKMTRVKGAWGMELVSGLPA